jgi:uncharacterized SAM-binding protein YcdF (DUF218 family)
MNDLFLTLGIEGWKPVLTLLVLPPLPLLLLVLVGARLMYRRRLLAWSLIVVGVFGTWAASTTALAQGLTNWLLQPPPSLAASQVADLKRAPKTAILVLGGGARSLAPEYGVSMPNGRGMERLHYGMWLARETALPVAFSGGRGFDSTLSSSEAEIAARTAERDFGRPIKWLETESRDTRENMLKSVQVLGEAGIEQVVLVTHDYHMRRAARNFERALGGRKMKLVLAPTGAPTPGRLHATDWLPSTDGFDGVRLAVREWLGWLVGA